MCIETKCVGIFAFCKSKTPFLLCDSPAPFIVFSRFTESKDTKAEKEENRKVENCLKIDCSCAKGKGFSSKFKI